MLAFVWKTISPDIELLLHSIGPCTHPARIDNCSWSRSGVRYGSRLPGGNASNVSGVPIFRPRISPSSTRQSIWSFGFNPAASNTDCGRVVLRFSSTTVALINLVCADGFRFQAQQPQRGLFHFRFPTRSPSLSSARGKEGQGRALHSLPTLNNVFCRALFLFPGKFPVWDRQAPAWRAQGFILNGRCSYP